jgi:hypothetical protein
MGTAPLPNPWNAFNLLSTPFWQDALGAGDVVHPLSLFVGREQALTALVNCLFGAGAGSSRRAIEGSPGVGKTTLVKRFKAQALENGFFVADGFVSVLADDTNESLFGRVLGAVYDILLANRPHTVEQPAMQAAQVLVRAAREKARSGGVSIFGVGVSIGQNVSNTSPKDLLLDGPRVLRDLMELVAATDARGVLVHINNLENVSEAAMAAAGTILRDLRDLLFMHNGLHVVLVGTPDAIQATVAAHPQVRTTFSIHTLDPMPPSDVHRMLEARYAWLTRDPARPVVPPVEPQAVEALYALYAGDLRGLLQALDDGVTPNIGLSSATISARERGPGAAGHTHRSLSMADIAPTLQQLYLDQLAALSEERFVLRLLQWGKRHAGDTFTQKQLATLWKVQQATVSETLAFLARQGLVRALPRKGRTAAEYVLTGRSRVTFA